MAQYMEKSMSVSARVDVRSMAVMALWLQDNKFQIPTRSGLVGQAVKMVEQNLLVQRPDLAVDSIEHAFDILQSLGLAPVNQQAANTMQSRLMMEQAVKQGLMDHKEMHSRLTRSYAQEKGLDKMNREQQVQADMAGIFTSVASSDGGSGPAEQTDDDRLALVMKSMLERGKSLDEATAEVEKLKAKWALANEEQAQEVKQSQKQKVQDYAENMNLLKQAQPQKVEKTQEQRVELGIKLHAKMWFKELLKSKSKRLSLEWLNGQMLNNFAGPQINMPLADQQSQEAMLGMIVAEAQAMYEQADVVKLQAEQQALEDAMLAEQQARHEQVVEPQVVTEPQAAEPEPEPAITSLDASEPDFMTKYAKREAKKLAELKAGLSGLPS